eukprot:3596801-Amphidinium_carterae.1
MWEDEGKVERARALLEYGYESGRLRGRPDALAAWAELEEQCGRQAVARSLYDKAVDLPGAMKDLLPVDLALRRAALEMRLGGAASAEQFMRTYLQERASLMEAHAVSALLQHYTWLCDDVLRDPPKSSDMLNQAWKNPKFRAHIVVDVVAHVVSQHGTAPGSSDCMEAEAKTNGSELIAAPSSFASQGIALFEEALNSCPNVEMLQSVMCSYIDFLLSCGAAVETLRKVRRRARQLQRMEGASAVPPGSMRP